MIKWVVSIGGASFKVSAFAFILKTLLGFADDTTEVIQGIIQISEDGISNLPNLAVSFLFGLAAGFVPKILEKNLGSQKAPKTAIKIYAPILWVTALQHLIIGSVLSYL